METKVISRRIEKADYSGLRVKKDWGFVNSNGCSFGYATKKQATEAAKSAEKYLNH